MTLNGSGLAGVSFSATNGGTCTQSDASGNYVCGVANGWSGSITPSLGAHGFTPASRSYTNVASNQTGQNYTAAAPLELAGTVSLNGAPLAGVTMSASAGGTCTQSNASGQYTCAVPPGWSGNVTPSLANHVFAPASRSYTSLSANQTAQDYAATVLRYVSGTARVNGLPVAGVAFAASGGGSCSPSNSAGQYSCAVLDGWTGSVTPSHMGYSFTPSSRSYTSLAADDPAEDYAATPSSPASNIAFVHVDHLNTPRLLTNDQGQTVWRWEQQEPFGVNVADENPSGLGVYEMPLRFPGQYFDKETNVHYNYFRDYDSGIGRYLQSDPIGLNGGLNTYVYVASRPLWLVDPKGLLTVGIGAGGNVMATAAGGTATSSVVADFPNLNVCFQTVKCSRAGWAFAPDLVTGGLTVQGSIGSGTLCSGSYTGFGLFGTGSLGAQVGASGVRYSSNGASVQSSGLVAGLGLPGAAAGVEYCEITLWCLNDPPCCKKPGSCTNPCPAGSISDIVAP